MTQDARLYETMYILNPALSEAEIESTQEDIRHIIKANGGTIKKDSNWGKRRLAYEINKITEGIYINIEFTANTELPAAFNEYVHTHTTIIRHLVFRIPKAKLMQEKQDEERAKKQAEKAQREKEEYEKAQAAKAAAAEAVAAEAAAAETTVETTVETTTAPVEESPTVSPVVEDAVVQEDASVQDIAEPAVSEESNSEVETEETTAGA